MTFAQATEIVTPSINWAALFPILSLIAGACVLLVIDALSLRRPLPGSYALFTVVVAGASIVSSVPLWDEVTDPDRGPFTILRGALGFDGFSIFFFVIIAIAVVLAALLADGYLRREGLEGPELYALIMLSASGGMVMSAANDLIVTFLGLEILSIAAYVLAAMHLRRIESQEAAIKYFVLGAFSSAFFLYGIALTYGATGTTKLSGIASFAPAAGDAFGDTVSASQLTSGSGPPAILLAGIGLLLVGFGFKIAAVPFHFWTPDVYQGSPSPSVAFMASAVKAAAFAGLLRVLVQAFAAYHDEWQPYVFALSVATLLVGATLAVVQDDVKRLLAYSSISHAGFILLGVEAASERGTSGALFYLAAYTFMVAGSFGIVTVVSRTGDDATKLSDFRGLAGRRPALALTFTVFLLAQAGVPLTAGFVAKFEVLAASVEDEQYVLALIAMVSAVIAAFLYLKIIVAMYMTDDAEERGPAPTADGCPSARRCPSPSPSERPCSSASSPVCSTTSPTTPSPCSTPLPTTAECPGSVLTGRGRYQQLGPLAGPSPRLARRVGVPPQLPHGRHLLRPRGGPPPRRSLARKGVPAGPSAAGEVHRLRVGVDPVGYGWSQSQIRYYIFALLFVMFDVEAVFIFPWATRLEVYDVFGLVEMIVFIAVLALGLVYAWRKGVLRWI